MGVWIETSRIRSSEGVYPVTPHVGVWIETTVIMDEFSQATSLPTWECGLKLTGVLHSAGGTHVTPHVGVWIETGR